MDVRSLSESLFTGRKWMKFVGVVLILYGICLALTILGTVIAWLPIWSGITLIQSAVAIEKAYISDDAAALMMSLSKLKTHFVIISTLLLLMLTSMAVWLFAFDGVEVIANAIKSL
ncbi:DUF5362 family protein [Pleionea sediminis]|uniref:DUF5362 family protein n=1 Tax=Pleionea sediminis TaxID=2569479 RepID=UPI0011848183|nr:DUF5362 family protein [Pleionea sediminis]